MQLLNGVPEVMTLLGHIDTRSEFSRATLYDYRYSSLNSSRADAGGNVKNAGLLSGSVAARVVRRVVCLRLA